MALVPLCRRFGVQRLELFGSANTTAFNPDRSDLDFLVEYPADYDFGPWLSRFVAFEENLKNLFGRPVHLVMVSALKNPWFSREAQKTREPVYDASQVSEMASRHS
ncbi:MAG TPA: nucleotidyltransferase domain-containing protein [Verrucomicrobiae bacterium]|nr:nucleotidyltransferase domain-containing protein [Verrucomicrobiae bacterium]